MVGHKEIRRAMRDPKRIPRIINKLEKYWEDNPDYRLGQLVSNISGFYTEDDDLEDYLDEQLGE